MSEDSKGVMWTTNAWNMAKTALVGALLLLNPYSVGVQAHGFLAVPQARNVQRNSYWCPQCLNAGGPWAVGLRGHGLCGDPGDMVPPRDHEAFGSLANPPVVAGVYKPGATIAVKVTLTANHKGRWSLKLCPIPGGGSPTAEAKALTQACLNAHPLLRADTKTPHTYVPPSLSSFEVQYKLPPKVTCKRCVLQWYYQTGNSCNPPGTPPAFATPFLGTCGAPNSAAGEEFWNCADISIVK